MKLNEVYISTREFTRSNVAPAGTLLVCTKGGKCSTLSLLHDSKMYDFKVTDEDIKNLDLKRINSLYQY